MAGAAVAGSAVALPAAVLAALVIGVSGVAQRRAALAVPSCPAGDPRLVAMLTRQRWWWIGAGAASGGVGLQMLALATGPLLLVQSVLVTSVVSTTVAERLILGRRPTGATLSGILLTVLGLVGVLVALAPTAGAGTGPSGPAVLAVAAGTAAVMLATVGWARRGGPRRATALAVCAGLGYGVTAVSLKQVGLQIAHGLAEPLGHPSLYVAVLLGTWSVLLSQSALQLGSGAVAVVTPILVVDPLVGVVAGGIWFGEGIATGPGPLAVAAAGLIALLAGMWATDGGGRRSGPDRLPAPGRAAQPVLSAE